MRFRGPRGECDRCGGEFYVYELDKQMVETDGSASTWGGLLVCRTCMDRVEPRSSGRRRFADPVAIFPPGFGKPP